MAANKAKRQRTLKKERARLKSKTERRSQESREQWMNRLSEAVAAQRKESPPKPPEPSLWDGLPEDSRELMEYFDGFANLRNGLRRAATEKSEWAGIPMPLDDLDLVIEPTHPYADGIMAMNEARRKRNGEEPEEHPELRVRNSFWSRRWRCEIIVYEKPNGRVGFTVGINNALAMQLRTLGASDAWGLEQESRALELLGTLLPHRNFKQYMLTGSFLERSDRSGITYLFRRLRPTVALREKRGEIEAMCGLCLHALAYYDGTWGGALTPTDEVVGHLMMCRADEHFYWKRSNQHPPHMPQAGIQ